jgi:GH43 family beta-xylosidase
MRRVRSYRNPVIGDYLGDPFVWQHEGRYFAIGTGREDATGMAGDHSSASIFPLYVSTDLAHWTRTGKALVRPYATHGYTFWAPEVIFVEGVFYLYYSVGFEDTLHHLRVATSRQPLGPYLDAGVRLTSLASCPFAIDPHPFHHDGRYYLFYASDFLDERDERGAPVKPGTALVVQELDTMLTLVPGATTVLRARHPWQRFAADRPIYGSRYDWHTLEGPCVVKHAGRFYCFYSGGRWDSERYGVDYAVADHPLGPYEESGAEAGPRVLRSVPGTWLGPGHNSVVCGPDGTTEYVFYHAWDPDFRRRQACVDALAWTSLGPRVAGPSSTLESIALGRAHRAG